MNTPHPLSAESIEAMHARNRETERILLAEWQTQPDRMIAYYKFAEGCRPDSLHLHTARTLADCIVTTWLGTKIGTITRANVYRHNLGSRFVTIRVRGTNGAEYYGRASWDWGDCIVLRRAKGDRG